MAFFGDRPIDRIEPTHITAYLKHARTNGRRSNGKGTQGLSSKTVQNHLTFLHGLFTFAKKRGWVASNPVAAVDRPRKARSTERRIRFLQPEELDAAIRAVPDGTLGQMEPALYVTAAMTGLRQGELLALRWRDVDWVAARVRVADNFPRGRSDRIDSPKSHEGRSVPMADRVAGELERLFQRSAYQGDDDLVFCHPQTGHVLDASKVRKRFAEALDAAHVRRITFHELRHTFGTQLAAARVPLRTIQEWMGHQDAKTTEIYRHYAPDPDGGAAQIEAAFTRGPNLGSKLREPVVASDEQIARKHGRLI